MSAMARRNRSEQRRLLGLRRAVHWTMAASPAHVPARLPAVVIPIIAAEQLGRRCYAMEIDPRYVAVAIKRWEDFTGRVSERIDG